MIESFQDEYWSNKHVQNVCEEHEILAMEMMPNSTQTSILDIGCGDGHLLSLFGDNLVRVGVDISQTALNKVSKDIKTYKQDITQLDIPYEDGFFDVILLLDVLEHTFNPKEVLESVGKYGNTIILTVPNMGFVKDRLLCLFGNIPSELTAKKGHCYYMTKKEIERIIRKAGYEVFVTNHYIVKIPLLRWLLSFFPSVFATMFCYKINKAVLK